jgi:hypothetical protein
VAKLVSVIGVLVICAGVDLLWQSRRDVRYWLATFVDVLRGLVSSDEPHPLSLSSKLPGERRHQILRVFLGMSLVLILGPIFLVVGVTLMLLYPNL